MLLVNAGFRANPTRFRPLSAKADGSEADLARRWGDHGGGRISLSRGAYDLGDPLDLAVTLAFANTTCG